MNRPPGPLPRLEPPPPPEVAAGAKDHEEGNMMTTATNDRTHTIEEGWEYLRLYLGGPRTYSPETGEVWEYMGPGGAGGNYHVFRHRDLPRRDARVNAPWVTPQSTRRIESPPVWQCIYNLPFGGILFANEVRLFSDGHSVGGYTYLYLPAAPLYARVGLGEPLDPEAPLAARIYAAVVRGGARLRGFDHYWVRAGLLATPSSAMTLRKRSLRRPCYVE